MKYEANLCNDLKTDIMEVNGKDFSLYPVETQRDMIIKIVQNCSPDDLRLICQSTVEIAGDMSYNFPTTFNYEV